MRRQSLVIILVALLVFCMVVSLSFAGRQPHMEAALKNLQNAKAQLEKATTDKGGHRVKAIELINQAMDEVNKGMAYSDDETPKKGK